MFAKKSKAVFLCMCMISLVFLCSCESNAKEVSAQSETDVNDAANGAVTSEGLEESSQEEMSTLQLLLGVANERRLGIETIDKQAVTQLAYSRDFVFYDLSNIIVAPTDELQRPPATITSEEAIEDTEILFDVLRYVYGAYQYFGGDDVFEPVRKSVVEDILQGGNNFTGAELCRILYRHLSPIIEDYHFIIRENIRESGGGAQFPFGSENTFLVSSDAFYDKTEQGFRNRDNGLYLAELAGYDMGDIMRLQLDEQGRHFYAPVMMRDGISSASSQLTIIYEDDTTEQIMLQAAPMSINAFEAPSSLEYIDDIPIVSLAWMMGMGAIPHGQYALDFLGFAEELRNEPIVILDLRSNFGGTAVLPLNWMYLLTGEVVMGNSPWLTNWDNELEYPWKPRGNTPESNSLYISEDDMEKLHFLFHRTIINGFPVEYLIERHIVERTQILIVLVDRYTMSAGEFFVDLAFNVENTLVIGQNTFGSLTCSSSYPHLRVPNSGIAISLGRDLMLHPEGHFAEGVGYRPDVWVTGDALAATMAMLANGQ